MTRDVAGVIRAGVGGVWVARLRGCLFRPGLSVMALIVFLTAAKSPLSVSASAHQPSETANPGYIGNAACARCHAAIAASYASTSMARASGPAIDGLKPADFIHKKSGVHYRIYSQDGRAWLSFERPGDPAVRGSRELLYFIGSGRRGRSYLFSTDGFFFESPVNWYADKQLWDMAPGYRNATEMPLNLPAYTSCLHCHASGMSPPMEGTENKYPNPLFAQDGVSCERCHGPGAAHAAGGPIANPAKLSAERRDEVCMQCHLEGKEAIERPGRHAYEFQPGGNLFDYIRYYVLAGGHQAHLGAVSQVEALAASVCKKKSGAAMSCTSCHDPHYAPPADERVAFYRGKCLACHGASFGAKHHPTQLDCTRCHMPSQASADIGHTQVTDHQIPRRPGPTAVLEDMSAQSENPQLISFPDPAAAKDDPRDTALAWESLAESGDEAAKPEAERLLRDALAKSPQDPKLLASLAYVEQSDGRTQRARELYEQALAVDPNSLDAATNLGVIEANRGDDSSALKLWQDAFRRAPGQSSLGMNIVRVYCAAGKFDDARTYTLRVLEFNPDLEVAKHLLQHLNRATPSCGP
jgi:tetratricopeptide (TPR) repeat protein